MIQLVAIVIYTIQLVAKKPVAKEPVAMESTWKLNKSYLSDVVEIDGDHAVIRFFLDVVQLAVNVFHDCIAALAREDLCNRVTAKRNAQVFIYATHTHTRQSFTHFCCE